MLLFEIRTLSVDAWKSPSDLRPTTDILYYKLTTNQKRKKEQNHVFSSRKSPKINRQKNTIAPESHPGKLNGDFRATDFNVILRKWQTVARDANNRLSHPVDTFIQTQTQKQ